MTDPAADTKVLVVDDHEMVLMGLADGIKAREGLTLSGTAATAAAALEEYERDRPDVVLLDYRLPDLEGDKLIRKILRYDPTARILMLTSYSWEEDVWKAVMAGAMGFIPKTCSMDEIYLGLSELAAKRRYFPPDILAKVQRRERREALTKRELDVLDQLATGKSNKEIMISLGVSENTVRTHISHIIGKLGATDRTHALVNAVKRGIVRLDDGDK